MREFLSQYSDQNDILNEDIIKNIRKDDNIEEKIDECCREIEKNLSKYVEYLGYDFDDSKLRFKETNQNKKKPSKSGKNDDVYYMNINPTYSRMAIFKFRIRWTENNGVKSKNVITMPIHIPKYIDDYHYFIRGNKYIIPYQLTDAITYLGKDDSVVLKTMTRAIKMSREKTILYDVHGDSYVSHNFYIHINRKKISFLIYYFSYFGFFRTMQYFGVDSFIKMYKECPLEPDPNTIFFKFGKVFMGVDRKNFNSNYHLRQYVASVLLLSRKNLDEEHIQKVIYWRTILGSTISLSKATEKGTALLWTFYVSADYRTIKNIQKIVGGSKKETTFSIVRWMFMSYSNLCNKNSSLLNKRLRLSEYLVTPFVRDIYDKLYRFLDTPITMRDKKRLLDIFKVSPSILLNAIIGKTKNKRQALNIAKFSSHVNDTDLLNVALKYTSSGPGTPIEKSGKLAGSFFRQFDPSYVGSVCITTTSNGDPGTSGILTPFPDVDRDKLMFIDVKEEK